MSKKYKSCIKVLTTYSNLMSQDIDLICQDFNHITNFNKFIQNLVFTWFILYVLMKEIIGNNVFPFWYWIIAHGSILIFSLFDDVKELQFSIDTDENWDNTQLFIVILIGLSSLILIARQIYVKSIKYTFLLKILLLNF